MIFRGMVVLLVFVLQLLFWRLVLPAVLFALRSTLFLVMTAFLATINGPREFTERLANEWTRRLIGSGLSPDHIDNAQRLSRLLAIAAIVAGYVIAVLFTVAVLRVFFGVFI